MSVEKEETKGLLRLPKLGLKNWQCEYVLTWTKSRVD